MHYTFMMSANENVFPMSIHTQPQPHAYLDFAAGVGRAPLACCLEILEACPRAELAAVYHQNQTQNRITFAVSTDEEPPPSGVDFDGRKAVQFYFHLEAISLLFGNVIMARLTNGIFIDASIG